ncbi:alpha/beta fold hydrolase [Mycobacterium intracellulare]|uniref:alpha/beta fold hydrolase n=1 Tax=Mycobacterium intracellulare TaxID=1767 RepID=UPI001EEF7581|nr:alpha/beta hydrolase [Mycobacterium intracellulare]MEE3755345.1 alpha/beta hydrolase [Mycobacterium intracellulare]
MDFSQLDNVDLRYRRGKRCATRNGGELYVEVDGQGPAIVCLNNFFIVAPAWRNVTTKIVEQHTVVKYDLQNQGVSTQRGVDFAFSEHIEDLLDLLDFLGLERVTLLASSISTLIARDFALKYPERVDSTIMVGPAFTPYGNTRTQLVLRDFVDRLNAGGARAIFEYLYPLVFTAAHVEKGGTRAYLGLRQHFLALNSEAQIRACVGAALEHASRPDLMAELTVPTMFVIGDGDHQWSSSMVDDACAALPGSRGCVIPRSGHMPMVEQPDLFEHAVLNFLGSLEHSAAGEACS